MCIVEKKTPAADPAPRARTATIGHSFISLRIPTSFVSKITFLKNVFSADVNQLLSATPRNVVASAADTGRVSKTKFYKIKHARIINLCISFLDSSSASTRKSIGIPGRDS